MPIFQIKRIISRQKWFNYIVTFFFWKMPKIWVRRTTLNREKKRGLPKGTLICGLHANVGNKTGRGEAKKAKTTEVLITFGPRMWSY